MKTPQLGETVLLHPYGRSHPTTVALIVTATRGPWVTIEDSARKWTIHAPARIHDMMLWYERGHWRMVQRVPRPMLAPRRKEPA